MTLKSSSSENNLKKQKSGISFAELVRQNIRGNLWLVLLAFLVMLFNYPVNMAMQLSGVQQSFAHRGYVMTNDSYSVPDDLDPNSFTLSGDSSVIGGADGPTSVFVAEKTNELSEALTRTAKDVLFGDASLIMFIVAVAAALCAFAMFRYLYSRQQTDFYHSLPVSRTKRFFANYVSGILFMLVSYALGLLGAVIAAMFFQTQGLMLGLALVVNAHYMLLFLLIYTATVAAMLLAGSLAVGVLAAGWLWSAGPAASAVIMSLKETHFDTLYDAAGTEQKLQYLSPIKYLTEYTYYPHLLTDMDKPVYMKRLTEIGPHISHVLTAALILTLAGMLVSLWLFQKRASESAGGSIAFRPVKPFVRIITAVLSALTLSMIGTGLDSLAWTMFFTVAGAVIVHAVMEIIIQQDVRKLFDHKPELLITVILSVGIVLGFQYDVTGCNRYVPETEDVSSAAVSVSNMLTDDTGATALAREAYGSLADGSFSPEEFDDYSYDDVKKRMKLTDAESIEALRKAAFAGLSEWGTQNTWEGYDAGEQTFYTVINWRLKNGREDRRNYYLTEEALKELMDVLMGAEAYKEAVYPILSVNGNDVGLFGLQLSGNDRIDATDLPLIAGTGVQDRYYNAGANVSPTLNLDGLYSADIRRELLEALKTDLRELRYEDYDTEWLSMEYAERGIEEKHYSYLIYIPQEEVLAAQYRIMGNSYGDKPLSIEDIGGYQFYDIYPIFDSFTHVKEVLSEHNIKLN
ncbi:MAG: DUF6449 domain-containing protein [Eubacteriales bacterium]|nr:DUF6449 domain-containing protein [Eubacteriales bacterium]